MGAITRSIANNITTSGVFTSSAITNSSVTGITTLANVTADGITFISSQTASNSASLSFTSGLTSTYKAYKFVFSNIKPRTDTVFFQFNLSTDSGSNYNVSKNTTVFYPYHNESDTTTSLDYGGGEDLMLSTAYQSLTTTTSSDADHGINGIMNLFNPAGTTFVKHFISDTSFTNPDDFSVRAFVAGYGNTTSCYKRITI